MRPLSEVFAFLETTQKELSRLLAAPTKSEISFENGTIDVKSRLQDLDMHYVFLYDRNNFEEAAEKLKRESGVRVPFQIRKLPLEYVGKIEVGLFGVLENFSFGAYSNRRLGASYMANVEIRHNDSKFIISCCSDSSDESKLSLCQLHGQTDLAQFPLGLPNIFLSHSPDVKEIPKQFEDVLKSLDIDETVMIDPMYNCVLFTRKINAGTKTTLSEYFDKSAQVSNAAVKIIDDMCEELLARQNQ